MNIYARGLPHNPVTIHGRGGVFASHRPGNGRGGLTVVAGKKKSAEEKAFKKQHSGKIGQIGISDDDYKRLGSLLGESKASIEEKEEQRKELRKLEGLEENVQELTGDQAAARPSTYADLAALLGERGVGVKPLKMKSRDLQVNSRPPRPGLESNPRSSVSPSPSSVVRAPGKGAATEPNSPLPELAERPSLIPRAKGNSGQSGMVKPKPATMADMQDNITSTPAPTQLKPALPASPPTPKATLAPRPELPTPAARDAKPMLMAVDPTLPALKTITNMQATRKQKLDAKTRSLTKKTDNPGSKCSIKLETWKVAPTEASALPTSTPELPMPEPLLSASAPISLPLTKLAPKPELISDPPPTLAVKPEAKLPMAESAYLKPAAVKAELGQMKAVQVEDQVPGMLFKEQLVLRASRELDLSMVDRPKVEVPNHGTEKIPAQKMAKAQLLLDSQAWTQAVIIGCNNGGLLAKVDGSFLGFIPFSQMGQMRLRILNIETELKSRVMEAKSGDRSDQDDDAVRQQLRKSALRKLVGEEVLVRVISVDIGTGRVVLSSNASEVTGGQSPEERRAPYNRKEAFLKVLQSMSVGDIVECTIIKLAQYGAFCKVHGIVGMLHISEISYKRIKHPADVLRVGQHVQVMVSKIDTKKLRIALSLKRMQRDPLLETLDDLVDAAESGQADMEEGNIPEVETVCQLLMLKDDITSASAGQRFRAPSIAKEFQLWLCKETEHGFKFLARKEFSMQEVHVSTILVREDIKSAVEDIVKVMSA